MSESTMNTLQDAYILDWWLVLKRTLVVKESRGRAAISFPYWLGDMANLSQYVELVEDDGGEYSLQPSIQGKGISPIQTGRDGRGMQIQLPTVVVERMSVSSGVVAVEFDMRDMSSGCVIRECDSFDSGRFGTVSDARLRSEFSKWG